MRTWTRAGTRVTALVATCTFAALLLAPGAGATLRVESAVSAGLVITDLSGTDNDNVIAKLSSTGRGLEWTVSKQSLPVGDTYEAGPGCRVIFVVFTEERVECNRLGAGVTANLLGGDDGFSFARDSLPVTDRVLLNGGSGNDHLVSGDGPDTLNGGSGNDRLSARFGDDTFNGGSGDDILFDGSGSGGNDTLNGNDGNDRLALGTGADVAEGGAGNDSFELGTPIRDERDHVNGGIGGDTASYGTLVAGNVTRQSALRIIEADLDTLAGEKDSGENDVLRSIESYEGGDGADIITGVLSSNASNYAGANANDTIFGSSGANTLTGGAGADSLDGNAGTDVIDGKSGEGGTAVADPLIDCGTGSNDLAIIDLKDDASPSGCEAIDRSPAGEGPHVRPRLPRRTRVRSGRASFRLSCPRRLRRPSRCAGTLRLRVRGATTRATRYSISRRRTRRVAVRLGAVQRRVSGRTVAQLVSRERGRFGTKHTTRRVVLRG